MFMSKVLGLGLRLRSCSPITVSYCILVATPFLPNIQTFAFVLTSLCSSVVLPKFKLLGRGTWANTLAAIYLCSLFPTSFTFIRNQTLLKKKNSHLSTCLWILMIFAIVAIATCCVVLTSSSCLLISLSLSATYLYINF